MARTGTTLSVHLLNKEILDDQDLYYIKGTDNE